jgi:hypothetical protein
MLIEAAVLVRLQQYKKAWIDVRRGDRQPPPAVLRREGAQEHAVAIGDDCRAPHGSGQIERSERLRHALPCDRSAEANRCDH